MGPNLEKIVHSLVKELKTAITQDVLKKLREVLPTDIASIVKEILVNEPRATSLESWLTIDDICKKYHVSRTHVGDICRTFEVSRKRMGKHNLVNENEYMDAHDRPMNKPVFLKRKNAA